MVCYFLLMSTCIRNLLIGGFPRTTLHKCVTSEKFCGEDLLVKHLKGFLKEIVFISVIGDTVTTVVIIRSPIFRKRLTILASTF